MKNELKQTPKIKKKIDLSTYNFIEVNKMYKIYQVEENETLGDIANKIKINEQDLRRINGFNNNYEVSSGDLVIIPSNDNIMFENYMIQRGDTIYDIARKYDISAQDLLRLNGLNTDDYIYPGENLLIPKNDIRFYFTEDGDTLEKIANSLETNIVDLLNQNKNITLMPEQLIIIKKEK